MVARTPVLLIATAVTLGLAAPGAAGAATKIVNMGLPPAAEKEFMTRYSSGANDFFPHTVAINVGDRVRFVPTVFHNVDIPPRGGKGVPLIAPTGQKTPATNDAAGAPFWFTGQPALGFTPSLLRQRFGTSASYSGASRVQSGLPLAQRPRPFSVRFTRAGTYNYLCDVHPGMKGVVRVLPRRRAVPSAAADARALRAQIDLARRDVKALSATTPPPAGIVDIGVGGPRGSEFFAFVPQDVTVPVGTTLQYRMTPASREVHTATTGPGDPAKDPASYLGQLTASLSGATLGSEALYPSEPPGATPVLTPTTHGNGFWNSGAMDEQSTTALPNVSAVRFDEAGTYQFYCLIHPFMHQTVTVQ